MQNTKRIIIFVSYIKYNINMYMFSLFKGLIQNENFNILI